MTVKRKQIGRYRRGDQVWTVDKSRPGKLLRRLADWKYWAVQIEGQQYPQAYCDHELTKRAPTIK